MVGLRDYQKLMAKCVLLYRNGVSPTDPRVEAVRKLLQDVMLGASGPGA